MVNVDDAFEVRYKKKEQNFEVLVDFDKLNEFKKKPEATSVYDVLADQKIFKDQRKGEIASENLLREIFGNLDEEAILKEIVLKGECQIPTSYINKMREEKKKHVINYIAENSINPATKSRYTYSMIEGEINKLRYNFKSDIDYKIQGNEVLALLKKVMPITIEKSIIQIKISGMHCGNFYGPFRKYGKVTKEFFDSEGNLNIQMEVTESVVDEVITFVKRNSNNEAEYRVVRE